MKNSFIKAGNEYTKVNTEPVAAPYIRKGFDIDFKAGIVYVDDQPLTEPYTKTLTNQPGDVKFPVTVPENCVFVLGDNRNESLDSRFSWIGDNGMIDTRYILGKALFRVFPLSKFGGIYG